MRHITFFIVMIALITLACNDTTPQQSSAPLVATQPLPDEIQAETPTAQTQLQPVSATQTPNPAGTIFVDSFEQEIYPFLENGKCSFSEAIVAANSGQAVDSCLAGVQGQSVIVLQQGEYHFTQADQTPPQFEWMPSILPVGSALPPIYFPLTIQGNGSTLIRDEGSQPFRFFELMVNSALTLENLTLQNGDVADDPGGAIYAMSAVLELNHVNFLHNHANYGGAVYLTLGAFTMTGGSFIENASVLNGGAINISSSQASIQAVRFESNSSGSEGGGLYADFVRLGISESIFLKNRITDEGLGSRGGGMYLTHVNVTITMSQFYQNESPRYGGAIAINNPELAGIDPDADDPIEQLSQQAPPIVTDMLTSIPGFQATLEAHPSGVYLEFQEASQVHNNCFANNITHHPVDPNWTSGILGRATSAENNYWGDPSGPGGKGPGKGDQVGKRITFAPFLTSAPEFCDPSLSEQQ